MSWAVLLSDYPRSVLRNEESVAILALLERQGGATEEELLPVAKDRSSLSASLLELHRNQLVTVTPALIRLTTRGKTLLDRFDLRSDIVEDILESLALSPEEQGVYRRSLVEYRERAYPLYQNSLRSMRTWELFDNRVVGVPSGQSAGPSEPEADRATVKLTILLRSFRNWLAHYPESSGFRRSVGQLDTAALHDDNKVLVELKSLGRRSKLAYSCMEWVDRAPRPELFDGRQFSAANHLHSLHAYVACEERMPTLEWLEACTTVLSRPAAEGSFRLLLGQHIQARLAAGEGASAATRRIARERADFVEDRRVGNDLLGALWAASSLEEFARFAAFDVGAARILVEQIREQCDRIAARPAVSTNHPAAERTPERP